MIWARPLHCGADISLSGLEGTVQPLAGGILELHSLNCSPTTDSIYHLAFRLASSTSATLAVASARIPGASKDFEATYSAIWVRIYAPTCTSHPDTPLCLPNANRVLGPLRGDIT